MSISRCRSFVEPLGRRLQPSAAFVNHLRSSLTALSDTTTSSSCCLSEIQALENPVYCCDLPMTPTPSRTSQQSVSISLVIPFLFSLPHSHGANALRIRKSELLSSMARQSNFKSYVFHLLSTF